MQGQSRRTTRGALQRIRLRVVEPPSRRISWRIEKMTQVDVRERFTRSIHPDSPRNQGVGARLRVRMRCKAQCNELRCFVLWSCASHAFFRCKRWVCQRLVQRIHVSPLFAQACGEKIRCTVLQRILAGNIRWSRVRNSFAIAMDLPMLLE